MAVVEAHIACKNLHDLDGIMARFGSDGRYDDEPWSDHRVGRDGVQSYYTELLRALPDLSIEITRRHEADACVVVAPTELTAQ